MGSERQHWDPARYARHAGFVAELGAPVVELLAPRPGERVLDLGCGDGALTRTLVERGCEVVAVDSSPDQVAAARALGLDARRADGEALAFRGEFDAVFSNAALHWMKAPDRVIAGVWRALRPGGRFVGELGGRGNVDRIRRALAAALARRGIEAVRCDPWYFPGPDEYRARLEAAGFRVESVELFPRPTPLPSQLSNWLETFAGSFLGATPPAERPALTAEVCEALEPHLRDASGRWTVDYVRLRFRAHRPRGAVENP